MDIFQTLRVKTPQRDIAWFAFFLLSGLLVAWLAIIQPLVLLAIVGVLAAIGAVRLVLVRMRRFDLELWQWMLLTALFSFMLLNYGFENLAFHVGGLPIIVSYALMYGCLTLALRAHPTLMTKALKEPGMVCVLILIFQTCLHLIFDLPAYKLWAIRDATMFLDGLFMTLGLLWAMKWGNVQIFMKWFSIFLVINLLYSYTLPWRGTVADLSPKSGVFQEVPLLGNYQGNVVYMVVGALFCMLLATYVVKWPRWLLFILAIAQIFGLAIEQARAMYVGLAIALIILAFVGEGKKSLKIVLALALAMIPLIVLTAADVGLRGRVGEVNMDFLTDHMRSITGARATPGMSNSDRLDWFKQALWEFYKHPWVGIGFGKPLLDEEDHKTGVVTRMPHNSSLSVLARLGVWGFVVWLAFNIYVLSRFVYALWRRNRLDKQFGDTVLWFFIIYIVFMIEMMVEPGLEFPAGAIPFYFFVGFALGLIRWQLPKRRSPGFASSSEPLGLPPL